MDREIITEEELKALVETKDESMELVLTGINMCESFSSPSSMSAISEKVLLENATSIMLV